MLIAGRERLASLAAEQATLAGAEDPQSRTRRAEIENAVRLLDKRVGDLLVMQHAADQSLPMIRLIQANAIQLVEKFNTVRNITIPSWKRQFAIQLSLGEQKNAVELSNAIDDATKLDRGIGARQGRLRRPVGPHRSTQQPVTTRDLRR